MCDARSQRLTDLGLTFTLAPRHGMARHALGMYLQSTRLVRMVRVLAMLAVGIAQRTAVLSISVPSTMYVYSRIMVLCHMR